MKVREQYYPRRALRPPRRLDGLELVRRGPVDVASVMRRPRVREDAVIGVVVVIDAIDIEVRVDRSERTTNAYGDQPNIHHVVAEASAIRPAAGDKAPV